MESSGDGRPWAGFMMSQRSGFTGTRRLACCKGSYKCVNDDCAYLKQCFKRNRVQFQVRSGESLHVYFMWILLQFSPQMNGEWLLF